MPFELQSRSKNAGFSLLEVVLAIGLTGLVLGGVYSIGVTGYRQQTRAMADLELAEVARAFLDEYRVTYPLFPETGTYKGIWGWSVTETPHSSLEATSIDPYFDFREVTLTAYQIGNPERSYAMSTVIAFLGTSP